MRIAVDGWSTWPMLRPLMSYVPFVHRGICLDMIRHRHLGGERGSGAHLWRAPSNLTIAPE